LDLKKRAEAMTEEVAISAKILDEEIKVFRKAKEADMQKLMIDFVQIQKQTSEEMQNHWSAFVNNSEA
jgi:hypothetical protein